MLCREGDWGEVLADALLGSAQAEIAEERWGLAEELLGRSLKAAEGKNGKRSKTESTMQTYPCDHGPHINSTPSPSGFAHLALQLSALIST